MYMRQNGVCFIDCKLCAVEHIDMTMDISIPSDRCNIYTDY